MNNLSRVGIDLAKNIFNDSASIALNCHSRATASRQRFFGYAETALSSLPALRSRATALRATCLARWRERTPSAACATQPELAGRLRLY